MPKDFTSQWEVLGHLMDSLRCCVIISQTAIPTQKHATAKTLKLPSFGTAQDQPSVTVHLELIYTQLQM